LTTLSFLVVLSL